MRITYVATILICAFIAFCHGDTTKAEHGSHVGFKQNSTAAPRPPPQKAAAAPQHGKQNPTDKEAVIPSTITKRKGTGTTDKESITSGATSSTKGKAAAAEITGTSGKIQHVVAHAEGKDNNYHKSKENEHKEKEGNQHGESKEKQHEGKKEEKIAVPGSHSDQGHNKDHEKQPTNHHQQLPSSKSNPTGEKHESESGNTKQLPTPKQAATSSHSFIDDFLYNSPSVQRPVSPARIGLAASTVFVTTVDDALWLTPFLCAGARFSGGARMLHAIAFVLTLQGLVWACYLGTWGIEAHKIKWFGVVFAWSITAILFLRHLWKGKRQQQEQSQHQQPAANARKAGNYGTIPQPQQQPYDDSDLVIRESAAPFTVASLTVLGGLDEISYFPSVIADGKVFTVWELAIGALIATVAIVLIISLFLSMFMPLIKFCDHIPLYLIVALYATVMTAMLIGPKLLILLNKYF